MSGSAIKKLLLGQLLLLVTVCTAVDWSVYDPELPTIEQLVIENNAKQQEILQQCIDRSFNRFYTMQMDQWRLVHDNLLDTHPKVLNNRIRAAGRVFGNDNWVLVDNTNKALDLQTGETERRIEQQLDAESRSIDDAAAVLDELNQINWRWQNQVGLLIFDGYESNDRLLDGAVYELSDVYASGGWQAVDDWLYAKADELNQLYEGALDEILRMGKANEKRLRRLTRQLLQIASDQ